MSRAELATTSDSIPGWQQSNNYTMNGKVPIIDFRLCNYLPQAEDVMIITRWWSRSRNRRMLKIWSMCVCEHSGWDGWGSQTILVGTEIGSDSHAFMSAIKGEVVRYCRRYFSSYTMPAHRLMGHFPPFIHWVNYSFTYLLTHYRDIRYSIKRNRWWTELRIPEKFTF